MNWQKDMVRKTLQLAGENTGVQLHFLLQRLEAYPDAFEAIIASMQDMAEWAQEQADALNAEKARREANAKLREIVNTTK